MRTSDQLNDSFQTDIQTTGSSPDSDYVKLNNKYYVMHREKSVPQTTLEHAAESLFGDLVENTRSQRTNMIISGPAAVYYHDGAVLKSCGGSPPPVRSGEEFGAAAAVTVAVTAAVAVAAAAAA